MFMPDSVLGRARAGAARLAVISAQRGRFALPAAYLSTVLGLCSPHVVYGVEPEEGVVEVIVTGTRLGSANTTSASPIAVVDSEELQHLGTPRTEDLVNSLPQVNSTLNLGANGAAVAPVTGTATADLRGIGAFRTLVLINGRRAAPGDTINPSADLNAIPSALVKRVEVLTGGASAIYGSDAIAGVVNFILDTSFTGFKLELEGGINRGSNNRGDLQAIERASGVTPRTGTIYDGGSQDVSVVFGKDLFDGSGHVTAYAGYRRAHEVMSASRDFGACTFTETGTSYDCLLDGTTALGQFVPSNGNPLTLDTTNGHAFRPLAAPGDLFNPAPYQQLQRPDARYIAGAFASYKLNDAANLYGEAQYMDDKTTARYEPAGTTPTGASPNAFDINCNNPLLSASQVNDLCTSAGLGPLDSAQVGIGRRNVEGGLRSDEFHHRSSRIVLGVKGDIGAPWSYDASLLYGRVDERETLSNDFSLSRVTNALNVVNVNGVPTCQSVVNGSDPACVPYNIFQVGGVTPAALNYITEGGMQSGYADRTIANVQLIGDLSHYGIVSPLARTGLEVAAGAEYRVESVHYHPDTAYSTGDLLVTGAAHPTDGRFRVAEIFAELKMPLIEDRPFAKELIMNFSDRYAHYVPQGNVNAYGFGLEWAPIEPVRLRGSVSRAVRAPNAFELFTSQVLFQTAFTDPCAGPTPTASAAQCALSGVTPQQYGNIASQSVVNGLMGGNPLLKPETADTVTAGIVLTPLSTFLFSADYWRIKVKKFISNVPPQLALPTCLNTGDPFSCSLIQRDANGSLSTGLGATAGRIVSTRYNTGSYGTSGVDFEGRYVLSLQSIGPKAGSLSFSFSGSIALDNPISVTPGTSLVDCTDLYGPTCSTVGATTPVPRWRHRLRMTWESHAGYEVSLNWRHIGRMNSEFTSSNPNLFNPDNIFPVDSHISAYDYLDLETGIDATEHVHISLGVNNLTDKKPPVIGFAANPLLVNGNMAAGVYDVLGRYLFAGLTVRF
jgi:iron complex outermembrane receptor protein